MEPLKSIKRAEMASTSSSVQLIGYKEPDAYYFRDLESKQICLNEAQINAVRHFKSPCLVIAGAGSGKTRVLASRVGHLISFREVSPKNILVLTFTNKAAGEMRDHIYRNYCL
jgi:DNA helicase-2/ATP-dependent DNA helicase PcrA